MDAYDRYRRTVPAPVTNRSWLLRGAGMEHFNLADEPVPVPGPRELLARVDAISICFSDVKLIRAGNKHHRVLEPLEQRPTVPGHEVALTVVQAGRDVAGRFRPGARYIIQADIYKNGKIDTFGYTQRGGMALFVILRETALDGDAGCYLLPMADATGYSEGALVEPWACVEAAYHISRATGFEGRPAGFVHPRLRNTLQSAVGRAGCALIAEGDQATRPARLFIPAGLPADEYTALEHRAADGAVIAIAAEKEGTLPVDAGAIHYRNLRVVSGKPGNLIELVDRADRTDLLAGGRVLFAGAGGPMGQMHIQRAFDMANRPSAIAVSDISPARLAFICRRFEARARLEKVAFETVDASRDPSIVRRDLYAFSEGGFDDIVVMAPVALLVAEAQQLARRGALVNIFAGLVVGTPFGYEPARAAELNLRFTGSSGSSMEDIRRALELVEAGRLRSDTIVRAVGGLKALKEGVQAVAEGSFPGKVVIYPHLMDLPLTTLEACAAKYPSVAARFDDGAWTRDAERELFNRMLG
ncbi:MAG: alcohol dehydrogenase catalytic domain-containing protein [Planctomycetota bacterium]